MSQLETATAQVIEPVPPQLSPAEPQAPLREEAQRLRGQGVGVFEQVTEHIRRDPQQSTRLLEAWIGDEAEAQG